LALSELKLNIKSLKGVGEKRAKLFEKLGITTVYDLLRHYPRGYEDFSKLTPISFCPIGEPCCIFAIVISPVRPSLIRKGLTLYKLRVADNTSGCDITFFNNKYIPELLLEGREYLFFGRMGGSIFKREMSNPEFEKNVTNIGLHPIYSTTEGLPSRIIASAVLQAFEHCNDIIEALPDAIRAKYELCYTDYAIKKIHQPKTTQELEIARRRLVFDELLTLQLGMQLIKSRDRAETSALCTSAPDFEPFYSALPFTPTGAQIRAIMQAAKDMSSAIPMSRLIEGDVGSGKTVVAAALCYYAAQNGLQSALMAPTEILAQQHYRTLTELLLKCGLNVGLLTGSQVDSEKQRIRNMFLSGEIDVAIGTHALVQEGVQFKKLGLVITDEQHRFGVQQRARLAEKGKSPHVLIMSATPIPRTLALMIYGDLDISVLDEIPAGRLTVKTYYVDSSKRERIYNFIKQHIDKGFQAFIVCPLVEGSESGLAAAEDYAAKIAGENFAKYRVGLMHGRLKATQKEQIMKAFIARELDLLVCTTVIEVGVDIPNAVIMVVENAERFGLSQLHQLRGRVGRGNAQSYCILISDTTSEETTKRFKIMCETSDGFKIAEKDLQLRGPGDFFGHRQHGLPELHIADIINDMTVLKETRIAANEIIEGDPKLESPENAGLRAEVYAMFSKEDVIFN
jgi:ATP-dependent DNA helicase RecG